MQTSRAERGVTLVEAAIVLAVVAIVVSAAAPGFRAFIEKQRLDGVARQLAADIRGTRQEAMLRNTPLRLAVEGSCYLIHTGAASQCRCGATGTAVCSGGASALKTVMLRPADGIVVRANVASMRFDPLHGTSTPAGTLQVVASSGAAVHHVVNVMGRVRSCSPGGALPAVSGYPVC